jgi:hypothetical protein
VKNLNSERLDLLGFALTFHTGLRWVRNWNLDPFRLQKIPQSLISWIRFTARKLLSVMKMSFV